MIDRNPQSLRITVLAPLRGCDFGNGTSIQGWLAFARSPLANFLARLWRRRAQPGRAARILVPHVLLTPRIMKRGPYSQLMFYDSVSPFRGTRDRPLLAVPVVPGSAHISLIRTLRSTTNCCLRPSRRGARKGELTLAASPARWRPTSNFPESLTSAQCRCLPKSATRAAKCFQGSHGWSAATPVVLYFLDIAPQRGAR
jgi:hypothetical protein